MSLAQAAAAMGARMIGAEARFGGVSTDTRSIGRGELFEEHLDVDQPWQLRNVRSRQWRS